MTCQIAIIIPVFNEEGNIQPMADEVAAAMRNSGMEWELLFVDDASTDGTWNEIRHAVRSIDHVRGIRHLRNAGQSAAIWTGFQQSQAPLIATLDGDLQNDPADLPQLLMMLDGCDLVCGVRRRRRDTALRRFSSWVARKARKAVLRVDFCDTGCGFRAFRREVLEGLFPFNGFHRFFPVLVHTCGGRTLEVTVNHRPRASGVSKYGVWNRLGRGIVDLFAIAWFQRRRLGRIPCETWRAENEVATRARTSAGSPRPH